MLFEFLISFVIAAAIFFLLRVIKARLLSSVPVTGSIGVSVVLSVSGSAPELEAAVRSLEYLRESGRLRGEIVLRDCGMEEETALAAETLARAGRVKMIC